MKKILFVTSEAHPLIKTGGLADVSGSLPKALHELGQDIRLIIPNYKDIKTTDTPKQLASLRIDNKTVNILETCLDESGVIVWLVDYPDFFGQPGNPYVDANKDPWPNNAERFSLFCRTAVEVAMNRAQLDWQADLVHCNDWQSGLTPAFLSLEKSRPATVFTIHNLAYQGLFPSSSRFALNLPGQLWSPAGLEFYDLLSFIKGGLAYADRITTVSPTYALEIQTPAFGYGLEGLLNHRQDTLSGIINGIDGEQWNPKHDPYIEQAFSVSTLNKKKINKMALQARVTLPVEENIPVIGVITRLVEQKGIDLILECLPEIAGMPVQFIALGSGDKGFEQHLKNFAHLYPEKIAIHIGYDEKLAHQIEAGADMFLMPSRFEPCGLNQMYSQHYGTLPIVRNTGGLADTVIDTLPHTIADNSASGFVFNAPEASSVLEAVKRALMLYNAPTNWKKVQRNAMKKDFTWHNSGKQYLDLYNSIE